MFGYIFLILSAFVFACGCEDFGGYNDFHLSFRIGLVLILILELWVYMCIVDYFMVPIYNFETFNMLFNSCVFFFISGCFALNTIMLKIFPCWEYEPTEMEEPLLKNSGSDPVVVSGPEAV
jgi:hypothetical protein